MEITKKEAEKMEKNKESFYEIDGIEIEGIEIEADCMMMMMSILLY